jgi:hypothetical protein
MIPAEVSCQNPQCAVPPTSLGSGFDESKMLRSDAIFFTPEGKVVRDDR